MLNYFLLIVLLKYSSQSISDLSETEYYLLGGVAFTTVLDKSIQWLLILYLEYLNNEGTSLIEQIPSESLNAEH